MRRQRGRIGVMRVLLIENESGVAQSLEPMLRSENFKIYSTSLDQAGIDLATIGEFDVIVLNMQLPDLSGFNLLRTFHAARIKIPILTVFDFAEIEAKIRNLGYGPGEYILNPIQRDELVARIHA